ncbi:BREX system P-loop protein BrxC [Myroides odoratimimus]|uniref:BREX system P-loop protein BrxC n=1 Tax=Myroides odoratimimus TaxID=76832 RepID=UPI00257628A9|nr:BREX system P-loop protein BrxC [Myroides odoratimimus]MDM1526681.1 BREX system P-loop protein BrxC [Myroides odoratimimus]
MKIKDLLSIDLSVDIKNVINIEDVSENEIQKEIEDYIVTDGLAKDFEQFIDKFTSNAVETGVWISGFYGSGKSYFSKMIGYLLANQSINGTPSRERLLHRFTGINDEVFFKNKLAKLDRYNNIVVFLDIAKQDTSKGFSYTLFKNFLKTIDLPQDEYGYMLFNSMLAAGKSDIYAYVQDTIGKDWDSLKGNMRTYFTACKDIHLKSGLSENEYDQLFSSVRNAIDVFAAADLARELKSYLEVKTDATVVFMFDETSEAVNQNKLKLLDLEGVSEALNTLGKKVWTIAIAQEKLDDVISNANISKASLVKVTDRFVEKIHLEATEVDTIIKSRILKKTEEGVQLLNQYYQSNSGKIGDHSNLNEYGISNTSTVDSYAAYYPFYENQFSLLQNFLFGTKGYASTKVAARGMIITTFDILRKLVKEDDLYNTVTGWQIAREANNQPDIRISSRYNTAENVLENHSINGRKLLETINFLSESEVVKTSVLNIAKAYFNNADDVITKQNEIKDALQILVETKILIETDHTYKITSDVEQKILDEMNNFAVQGFLKKGRLIDYYKKSSMISQLSSVTDGIKFNFNVQSDDKDDIANPNTKELAFQVKSLYTMQDNRVAEINQLKTQYDEQKGMAILYPENDYFTEIDKLIDTIIRIEQVEAKYPSKSTKEGQVVQNLLRNKEDKEHTLKNAIDKALANATLIYCFNTTILNESNYATEVQNLQRKMGANVYNKRLQSQMQEAVAVQVIKEQNPSRLATFFNSKEFGFFDANGNFVGENLSVVEEVTNLIRNSFVPGSDIESKLAGAPTGYTYGTVIVTLAALLRAGRLAVKTSSQTNPIYAVTDKGALEVFSKANEFKKASFKANTQSLTAHQKKQVVEFFLNNELDYAVQKVENYKVDYNTNDFQLALAIRDVSKIYVQKIQQLTDNVKDFTIYFPKAKEHKDYINAFTSQVTPDNYISRVNDFIVQKEDLEAVILKVDKMEKFVKNNLKKLQDWAIYIQDVKTDLLKANALDASITDKMEEYDALLKTDVTKAFAQLQQLAQEIKDKYHAKFKGLIDQYAVEFKKLQTKAEDIKLDIEALPNQLNAGILSEVKKVLTFAQQRAVSDLDLDFSIVNKKSGFSYSEYATATALINQNDTHLEIQKASIIRTAPAPVTPPTTDGTEMPTTQVQEPVTPVIRKIKTQIPTSKMTVVDYKVWLTRELQKVANAQPDDEIEFED